MWSVTGPLIGRDREFTAVMAAWRARSAGVLAAGPPGIGRTALALAVFDELRHRGADAVMIRVTAQSSTLPLVALGPLVGPIEGGPARSALTEVSEALRRRVGPGGVAIVIDDAHHLDGASQIALAELVDERAAFVLLTAPDHRIGGDLLTHGALRRVDLGQLGEDEVAELIRSRGVEVADVRGWHARSGGNPTAVLRLIGSGSAEPPEVPSDVLDIALARLDPSTRDLVDVIAVAQPVPVDVFDLLHPERTVDQHLAALNETRMFVEHLDAAGTRWITYLHDADTDAVLSHLRPIRLRSVIRRVVRSLANLELEPSDADLVRLTALALSVGEPVSDDRIRRAARVARHGSDGETVMRLARAAATARGATIDDLLRYVDVAYELADGAGLEHACGLLSGHLGARPDDREAATALAVVRANQAFWRHGDTEAALEHLTPVDGRGRSELDALRARILAAIGALDEAIALAGPIADGGDPRSRVHAVVALAHALRRSGRGDDAVTVVDSLRDDTADDDPTLTVSRQLLGSVRSLALAADARWSEAAGEAEAACALAERHQDRSALAIARLVTGLIGIERGDLDLAVRRAGQALADLESLDQPAGRTWALSTVALAEALAGDVASATATLRQLDQLTPRHPADLFPGIEDRARAWTLARSEPDRARSMLLVAAESALERGDHGAAVHMLVDLAALGSAARAAELLGRPTLAHHDGAMWTLARRFVDGASTGDHVALASLADDLVSRGATRWAVEAMAAAARSAARRSEQRLARRLAGRVDELTASCSGLMVPSLLDVRTLDAGVAALTLRERDVALLAAGGMANRAIAERLGISARTVEAHLANCFAKLGISSRSELGELLGPGPG